MSSEWTLQFSRSAASLTRKFAYELAVEGVFSALGIGVMLALKDGSIASHEWREVVPGALGLLIVAGLTSVPLLRLGVTLRDAALARLWVEGPVTHAEDTQRAVRFTVGGVIFQVTRVDLPAGAPALREGAVKMECLAASREVVRLWTRPRR